MTKDHADYARAVLKTAGSSSDTGKEAARALAHATIAVAENQHTANLIAMLPYTAGEAGADLIADIRTRLGR